MFMKAMPVVFGLALITTMAIADEPRVAFPANYATSFKNYLSLDRTQNEDQIIRLFANETALTAANENKELPDGSILIGEIYAAKKDKDGKVITSALGRRIREKLVAVAVMEKKSGWGAAFPDELRNGDWDFGIFSPDGAPLKKDLNTCRQCHAPLKETQHLFSLQHLGK